MELLPALGSSDAKIFRVANDKLKRIFPNGEAKLTLLPSVTFNHGQRQTGAFYNEQGRPRAVSEGSSPPGHSSFEPDQLRHTFTIMFDVTEIYLSVFVLFM